MRMTGPVTAVLLCALAFVLALRSGFAYGLVNAFSLGMGAVSLLAMSQCLVLAARPRFLEPLFGGLDRMYAVHKWLGIAGLGAMVAHDLGEPEFEDRVRESLLGEFGATLGQVAYYPLIALILLSWVKRIPLLGWEVPWQLWWFSHRLTGTFFAVAVLHQLLVDTPLDWSDPLIILLNIAGVAGIASYLFVELFARAWRRRAYTVVSAKQDPGATTVTLRPQSRPMRWRPGQFAFLSLPGVALGEAHPFTISSGSGAENAIQFSIKPLGDWTRRVPSRMQPGTTVEVEGPYGRFDFRKGGSRQVWLAGGVGITPFLAWVQSLREDEPRQVHLLYSVRTADEAIGLDIFREAADRFAGLSFDLIVTQRDGHLDAEGLLARVPFEADGADFFFCGPPPMRRSILKGLEARGVQPSRTWFELFEFR